MSDEATIVRDFIRERHEYVAAARASSNNDADYYRWQGHMEARRQLAQQLKIPYLVEEDCMHRAWLGNDEWTTCNTCGRVEKVTPDE